MNLFDLQIQTTASDGKHPPAEIVAMAKKLGVATVAITDHDTISGVSEAMRAGEEHGVRVIPGIEMSVEEHDCHILGYGIDIGDRVFNEALDSFQKGRMEGAKKMVENLKNAGFVVEWEDVLAQATGSSIARPHIVRAIMKRREENKEKLEGVDTMHDFFEKYLGNDSPYFVRRAHISAHDAIALIHEAGGVAVWSHPAIHFRGAEATRAGGATHDTDYEALETFLKELVGWGIDGLEAFNPSHTEDDAECIQGLAGKYALIRTAGSDFHEKGEHMRDSSGLHSADTVGDYETYGFSTEGIIEKLDEAIAKRKGAETESGHAGEAPH